FIPSEWIGLGKQYSNAPFEVINAKNAVLQLPANLLPDLPPLSCPETPRGKFGKHEPVTESSNISALSKISVQVFENLHGAQFRSIPMATAVLQTKQFAHIPSINFLCLLSAAPKIVPTGLELGAEDSERFRTLSRGLNGFNAAMTLFRKSGK
ncbi:hypothetical protein B0H17DRAFT_873689, partial [Mycena rosella]